MRKKIAIRNLVISQIIIFAFLISAYYIWFPYSFTELGGFYKTAFMLIFVDLILGPLLVFIIYKEGKKNLTFDINVLLGIQLLAFLFGAYSLYLKHPAYAVFVGDRFTLTNVNHIYPQQTLTEQLQSSFFSSPKLVIAKTSDNSKKHNKLLFDVLLENAPDIDARPEYYQPFEEHIETVFAKSINIKSILLNDKTKELFTQFLQQNGGLISDYAYLPLRGNNEKDMIWVFNRATTFPVGIIDSDPWKLTLN